MDCRDGFSGRRWVPIIVRRNKRERFAWAFAAVALLLAAALALVHFREIRADMTAVRFSVYPPENGTLGISSAISPDGRSLAFVVNSADGRRSLWLRRLDSLEARPLAGVSGDWPDPFWSPDSRLLGFFSVDKLRKIDVSGGSAQVLSDARGSYGGTWNRDGVILIAPMQKPLFRVSADGGTPMPVTTLDQSRGEYVHSWPQFLPDGRHFLYLASSNIERDANDGIYAGALDSKERKRLVSSHWRAAYASAPGVRDGYLLFLRDGTLMAQRFDPDRLELSGEAVSVVEKMGVTFPAGAPFSLFQPTAFWLTRTPAPRYSN